MQFYIDNEQYIDLSDLFKTEYNGQIRYYSNINDMNEEELKFYKNKCKGDQPQP